MAELFDGRRTALADHGELVKLATRLIVEEAVFAAGGATESGEKVLPRLCPGTKVDTARPVCERSRHFVFASLVSLCALRALGGVSTR